MTRPVVPMFGLPKATGVAVASVPDQDHEGTHSAMMNVYELDMTRQRLTPRTIEMRLYWTGRLHRAGIDLLTATTDDLHEFIETHPHWSIGTLRVVVSSMRSFFGWAQGRGYREDNPAREVPLPERDYPLARMAEDDAITSALESASLVDQAILLLGAEGGLRCSEIAGLRESDRDGEFLNVKGKGRKLRPIHLTPECLAVLQAIEATSMRSGFYFPSDIHEGRHLTANTIWRHVSRLTGYNTHALRHRAGTTVYRKSNHDLRLAQAFLGHSSPAHTAIYLHVERDDLRRASAAARMATQPPPAVPDSLAA